MTKFIYTKVLNLLRAAYTDNQKGGKASIMEPVILTAAVSGNKWMRQDTPNIPITAEEIVRHGLDAVKAGASVLHIHARDENGGETRDPKHFLPILTAYRTHCPQVILEMSVGAIEGRTKELLAPLLALRPDAASFNLKADAEETAYMFETFARYQVKPVFEVFDQAMADKLKGYIRDGLVTPPVCINLVFDLVDTGTSILTYAEKLLELIRLLPVGSVWSVTRGGFSALNISALAAALGGHLRTGLEDSIFLEPGAYARDSAQLIRRAADVAASLGRPPATPEQARRAYGL